MDFAAIIKLVGPQLIGFLRNYASDNFKEEESDPQPSDSNPSSAIRHLQAFLNKAMDLDPPLEEDGWLGPLTEQAIDDGIAKLQAAGIG